MKYTAEIKRKKKAQIESVEVQIAENVLHRDEAVSSETIRHYDDKVKYLQLELDDINQSQNNLSRQYNTAQKYYFSERSSRYFLKKKFCTKNAIKVLVNSQGEQVRSDCQILQEGFKFYSTLYRKPAHQDAFNTGLLAKFLNKIPGDRIPLSAHTTLDKPFTRAELFNALKAMKKNTSPGTDGITMNFYLTFWPLLGEMVFNSLMDAQRTGKMSISQRRGLIRLIPKEGKNMLNIANWQPITLLNVDFKILTKALALCLGQILPDLLHNDQKGFVRGCYSGENILDVYAMIQNAQNDDQEYALLMLDIEKAFDSISLHFLEEVLFAFGVPPSFIHWIQILYQGKELRLVNNGHALDPITPLRGSAQGCSLSLLLFVMVMEALALSIRANANIQGFQIGDFHKKIAMLADDTLLALKGNHTSFEAALQTLQEFAILSNLKINEVKSVVIPLNMAQQTQEQLWAIAPFKWLQEPSFTYHGIDIELRPNAHLNRLSHVLPAIQRKLVECDNPAHTLIGRILVVKSLIASKLV